MSLSKRPGPAEGEFLFEIDEEAICQAQQQLPLERVSAIPAENEPLRGLADVNQELVRELGRRCGQKIATVDLDATIIESSKREAQPTYQGSRGDQPMLALWAELDVVAADQFRDGTVPAMQDPLSVARRAWQALPETVEEFCFRGGSACYESGLPDWPRDENREKGPQGLIGFAVSAPMTKPLKGAVLEVSAGKWESDRDEADADFGCAPVEYYPGEPRTNDYGEPLRYVAIRVNKKQGELFASGGEAKYFAVVQTCGTGQRGVCRSGGARDGWQSEGTALRRCGLAEIQGGPPEQQTLQDRPHRFLLHAHGRQRYEQYYSRSYSRRSTAHTGQRVGHHGPTSNDFRPR